MSGLRHKPECKCRLCNIPKGSKHWNWRGSEAMYNSIHAWITRTLGKPMACSICKTKTAKKLEWANISGEYKRDPSDWIRLCTKCHIQMDGRFGEGNGQSKFTELQLKNICLEKENGVSPTAIMKKFGISKTHYYRVIKNKARC